LAEAAAERPNTLAKTSDFKSFIESAPCTRLTGGS
jgi:hypothetical protein